MPADEALGLLHLQDHHTCRLLSHDLACILDVQHEHHTYHHTESENWSMRRLLANAPRIPGTLEISSSSSSRLLVQLSQSTRRDWFCASSSCASGHNQFKILGLWVARSFRGSVSDFTNTFHAWCRSMAPRMPHSDSLIKEYNVWNTQKQSPQTFTIFDCANYLTTAVVGELGSQGGAASRGCLDQELKILHGLRRLH